MTGKLHVNMLRRFSCNRSMLLYLFSVFNRSTTFGESSSLGEALTPVVLVAAPVAGWWKSLMLHGLVHDGRLSLV